MANGNDITLKMNVDIKDADSAIKSFTATTQKAFKSSNTYVNSLGNSLNKVTQNIQNTKAKMDTLANTRVPTDKFKTLQTTIASLEKQISSAKKELDAIGKTRLYTTQYQGVTDKVNDLSKQLQVARGELGKLQAFGTNKNKGATLAAQFKVNSLTKQLKYAIDKQIQLEQAGQKFQANSAYDTQAQKVNTLTRALQQANYQAQQMQANNTAYMSGANTEQYAQLSRQLGNAVNQGTILQKTINNIQNGGHKLAQIFKNFGTSAKNAISRVANAIKNKLNGAINHTSNNHNKSFKKMLTTVLKYGFGIRSIFLLYRKLRAVMKEGLTSMAQQFTETRVQVDSLKNSWSGFKASLVSAFQPIFSYVVPALVTLINYLTSAMNTLANFFAILTGQGWYYKAKKGNESVAKSIGGTGSAAKEANEQLAEYDDLLVIDQNNSGSGGGGGGGSSDSDAWNWEKTDASPSKFAELLKEAFKTWDFTEVGEYIGQKLTDALNSINWNKVYKTAKNFGKGLATFLNGLISPDLFGALGTTIANAITTALEFLNTFGTTLDWKDFGNSIAEGIKKFVEHSPLKLAVTTFNTWANGILDMLVTAVRNLLDSGTIDKISDDIAEAIGTLDLGGITWKAGTLISGLLNSLYIIVSNKDTWKELGTKIGDGINGLFKSMNQVDPKTGLTGWGALAQDVSSLATGLLEMITRAVETIEWDEVGQAIADFIKNIDWSGLAWDLVKLAEAALGALVDAIKGFWDDATWQEKVGAVIVGMIAAAKLLGLTGKIQGLLNTALKSKTFLVKCAGLTLVAGGITIMSDNQDDGTVEGLGKNLGKDLAGGAMTLGGLKLLGFSNTAALTITGVLIGWELGTDVGSYLSQKIADSLAENGVISREAADEYIDISKDRGFLGWKWWVDIGSAAFEVDHNGENRLKVATSHMIADLETTVLKYAGPIISASTTVTKFFVKKIGDWFSIKDEVEAELEKHLKDLKTVFSNFANQVQNLAFEEKSGIKLQKNVNYEFDDKGGITYAYKDNNENNEIVAKYKLDFEVLYNKGFISKKDLEQFTENIEKFKKFANRNGINIKSKFDMIGDIDSVDDLKKFMQMMNVVNDFSGVYESQYNIDVGGDVDKPSDIDKLGGSMNYLQGQWKNKDSKMTVTSSVDGQVGGGINALQNLGNSFKQKLYDIWKNRDANFGVTTSGVDGASRQYNGLKDIWKNQSANFSITSTGGPEARQQFNDTWNLFDTWGNKSANFEIGLNVSAGTVKNIANDVINKLNKQLDASGFFKNFNASPIPNIAAKGGIATTATFGIWGEAGTEALVPLENNLGWLNKMATMITDEMIATNRLPDITKGNVLPSSSQFLQATSTFSTPEKEDKAVGLLEQILGRMNTDTNSNMPPIVLQLNGRQVAQVVWDENHKMYKQTGNPRYAT